MTYKPKLRDTQFGVYHYLGFAEKLQATFTK